MKVQDTTPERLGPYHLLRRLGEGGMGVVYLATDASGAQVALKALHPGLAQESNARRRMSREVETMRRVRSRYVAEVLDADLDGDPPYIVTRYVPGLSLDEVVGSAGPLAGPALARLAYGLAEALSAVHAAGVVHRDLKPGNVMIADGEPVMIDFGIAQLPETTRLTLTGMFMGTPGYLAPEVIEGKESGPASDVHSWAATVAFAATGRPPYGTGPFETIFYRIVHGAPNLDTLPAPLEPIIVDALSRDPTGRPSASDIGPRIAALDPALLIPSPPAAAARLASGPAYELAAPLPTVGDGQEWRGWPSTTKPLTGSSPRTNPSPSDLRELLPPVNYGTSANGGQAGHAAQAGAGFAGGAGVAGVGGAGFAGAAGMPGGTLDGRGQGYGPGYDPAVQSPGGLWPGVQGDGAAKAARTVGPITSWSPLVIATVAMVVAISVMAPIFGSAIALAVLVILRAVTITSRHLQKRQSEGGKAGQSVVAIAFYPLAAVRAVIGLLLAAPVAILAFCVTVAITIIAVPIHPLPQAVAFGAGALVATVGLGPGSSGSRTALAKLYTSAARSTSLLAVAYVGIIAVAAWAAVTAWYQSPSPAYWPINSLHNQLVHLPTIRSMLTDIRHNLLGVLHSIGL
jgi:serine/threonine protein kinase